MKIIMTALVAAVVSMACLKSREPQIDPEAALASIQSDAGSIAAPPRCPEREPCPECETVDAVYYSMLHRIERGRPESYVSTAHVHRGGRWYRVANVFPDGMEGPGTAPVADFDIGDALLAHVRAHPTDVGVKTIAGDDYAQRGRVLASWQPFDRIEDAPGIRASLASVFVLIE